MRLEDNPIIAAVRTGRELEGALASEVPLIFLLSGSILTLKDTLQRIHAEKKQAFVHIDLAEGIGKDNAGIAFLAELGADGIISTRAGLIRAAGEYGLETVQRFFLVDSHSVETAIESIRACDPVDGGADARCCAEGHPAVLRGNPAAGDRWRSD